MIDGCWHCHWLGCLSSDTACPAAAQLPLVHVYTFMKNETEAGEVKDF
jgi:hypothetical protein